MTHGSLFSGIGGADLAAQWAAWENVFHCEKEPFCQTILKYYWPNATLYEDITTTDFTIWQGKIDVLTGGFPCQPFSIAGKRKGTADDRHLWPEMLRAIREIRPRWVVGENVRGIVNWNGGVVFEQVCADLENEGYKVLPFILPACAVDAPHRRDRVWFVAYCNNLIGRREQQQSGSYGTGPWNQLGGEDCKHVADTNRIGSGQIHNEIQPGFTDGQRIDGDGSERDVADTEFIRLQRRWNGANGICEEAPKRQAEICNFDYWQNFPTTEPTIRSGDDGISNKSHRITIPKKNTMDRTQLILKCLSEGRIITDPQYGKIFSSMIRGHEGELIELHGSDCNGYVVHSIKYNGIKKQVKAHQVIYISVYGQYDKNLFQIDHINRNRTDNRISNLRLVSAKENVANQERYKGQFTDEEKDKMCMLHFSSNMSYREIAEDFGCSKSRVHQIISEHNLSELDGISFSKWRNESIKGFGNAWVPQVALQIFKAINEIENR